LLAGMGAVVLNRGPGAPTVNYDSPSRFLSQALRWRAAPAAERAARGPSCRAVVLREHTNERRGAQLWGDPWRGVLLRGVCVPLQDIAGNLISTELNESGTPSNESQALT